MQKVKLYILIGVVILITINLWLLSKSSVSQILGDPLRSTSQIFSLTGVIFMSVTLLLSTRFSLVEKFIGGLDEVYGIHHVLGSIAFIFLINHPLLLAIKSFPSQALTLLYLIPGNDFVYNLGIFALYIMLLSFIFMFIIKLPFHIWRFTHRFLGATFLLGSIHALLITSDISSNMPLRYWMLSFMIVGTISSFYIIFFYKSIGPIYRYEVMKVERVLDIIHLYLTHSRKKLQFLPGQFVYIRCKGKNVTNEEHPFSISSSPQDPYLRLSAKLLGDYTLTLPELNIGDKVAVYGPYGKFGTFYAKEKFPLVLIAGGIGVTPFVSMLRDFARSEKIGRIILLYCTRKKEEAVFLSEITSLHKQKDSINCYPWISVEKGRFAMSKIKNILKSAGDDYYVQVCGPKNMMESVKKQCEEIGIEDDHMMIENFSLL